MQASDAVAQGLVQERVPVRTLHSMLMKPEPLRSQLMVQRCEAWVKCVDNVL